jgi:branched-chain amino acid transport system substrate-binding protein
LPQPASNMQRATLIGLGIIALIAISVLTYQATTTGQAINEEEVVIGALLSETGAIGPLSESTKEGMQLALDEINSAGGINGEKLRVEYQDSESSTTVAVTNIQQAIGTGKKVIIVGASSSETIAQAPIAEEAQAVIIAVGSAANEIRNMGDYIFRVKASVAQEVKELAKIISNKFHKKRMYVVHINNAYGFGVRDDIQKYFTAQGGEIVGISEFNMGEKDFKTIAIKIQKADPDVILIGAWPGALGQLVKEIRSAGVTTQIFSTSGPVTQELITVAGPQSNGVIYISEYNIESEVAISKNFRENYNERYDKEPNLFSAMGYDVVYLLANGIAICGEPEPDCVKEQLYATQGWQGASGTITFDDHGDVLREFTVMTVRDEAFSVY